MCLLFTMLQQIDHCESSAFMKNLATTDFWKKNQIEQLFTRSDTDLINITPISLINVHILHKNGKQYCNAMVCCFANLHSSINVQIVLSVSLP